MKNSTYFLRVVMLLLAMSVALLLPFTLQAGNKSGMNNPKVSKTGNHSTRQFKVPMTTLTKEILFTPVLVAIHQRVISPFVIDNTESTEISRPDAGTETNDELLAHIPAPGAAVIHFQQKTPVRVIFIQFLPLKAKAICLTWIIRGMTGWQR